MLLDVLESADPMACRDTYDVTCVFQSNQVVYIHQYIMHMKVITIQTKHVFFQYHVPNIDVNQMLRQ